MKPTLTDRVLGLLGVREARTVQIPQVLMHFQFKSERYDVTVFERVHETETKKVELHIGTSETRFVTELVTSFCTVAAVRQRLLITTGSHVFVCDGEDVAFEDRVPSDAAPTAEVSRVLVVGDLVVLGTEFEVYSLDLRVMPPRFVRRWSAKSGLLDELRFDGQVIEMSDEGGNAETCRFD